MRFDKIVKLITLSTEDDGLGGRTEVEKVLCTKYANIENVSFETTMKIFGEAITRNVKITILGDVDEVDLIRIDDIKYKILSKYKIKNKTSFFLEVDND